MTRALVVIAAFLTLSVSAALAAPPADKVKPEKPGKSAAAAGQSADKNAAKACKAERALGVQAFKERYGTNPNKANAFGKCVSGKNKSKDKNKDEKQEDEDEAEDAREDAAVKKCQAERESLGVEKFKETYGTNANKANAFGKCVSKFSKKATTS